MRREASRKAVAEGYWWSRLKEEAFRNATAEEKGWPIGSVSGEIDSP